MARYLSALFAALLLPLLSVSAQAQSSWPEKCKLHRVAVFPMTPRGSAFTIPVIVNGVEKKFLIDTGGYASSVNEDVAKELNIPLKKIIDAGHIDVGGQMALHWVTVNSFKLGSFEGKNYAFVANSASGGGAFDGTLAPDLFRNFDVELDFANQTMTLFKPHACDGRAVYWTPAYLSLPMRITDSGHIRIKVQVDGKDLNAVVDTGASSSAMTLDDAKDLFDIKPDGGLTKAEALTGSNGGVLPSYTYGFKTLSLGEITLNHPQIRLYEGSNVLRSEGAQLILGMKELRFLHLYLAYQEREMYISVGEKH